ncbi:MAG: hypothetical protein ACRDRL_17620, partial [Sciscionella sp.]
MTKNVLAKDWRSIIKSWPDDGTIRSWPPGTKKRYVGVNLSGVKYYGSERPFLNVFKQSGANGSADGSISGLWFCSGFSYNPHLLLDADGNVTSMKDSTGTTQSEIFAVADYNLNGGTPPPNAPALYPTGVYRLIFSGPGTLFVQGDLSIRAQDNPSLPAGLTLSGSSVISTLAQDQSATIYVYAATATASGLQYGVNSLANDGVSYIKLLSLVESQYTSLYDGGQIFHPDFLASLAYTSRARFMDWHATNFQSLVMNFTTDLALNATSGTLGKVKLEGYISGTALTVTNWDYGQYVLGAGLTIKGPGVTAATTTNSGSGTAWVVNNSQTVGSSSAPVTMYVEYAWTAPSGTYTFVFGNGQVINNVICTNGSSGINWTTQLSAAVSSSGASIYGGMSFWVKFPTWASRPKMSNFSWATHGGVPYEVQMLLCEQLGIDGWFIDPLEADYCDPTYTSSLAALMHTGAGAALSGPVTVFNGRSKYIKKDKIEGSNEVWNLGTFGKNQAGFALMVGTPLFMGKAAGYNRYYAAIEWMGTRVAGIGDAFYTEFGADFSSRVAVTMGTQTVTGTGPAYLAAAMNTPDWTSAAATHHIAGGHLAPYFWLLAKASGATATQFQTDLTTIAALADPVGEGFSLAYSATGKSGNTYASLVSTGYVRGSSTSITTLQSIVSAIRGGGYSWSETIELDAYECSE